MEPVARIADANLNRAREGLRVLEDVARFALDDAALAGRLKDLRHTLREAGPDEYAALLSERDSAGDVGASQDAAAPGERADLQGLVAANSRRAQEALRVLEELARLPDAPVPPGARLQAARFQLYDLERALSGALLRREARARVRGLYVLLDARPRGGLAPVEVARAALEGGARLLQLREKSLDKGQLLPLARELRELCEHHGALFFVNDHADLAVACGAHGLHVGQKDLPVAEARRLLPLGMLVGTSTNNLQEALAAQEAGADYVAVGSIFPTSTKGDTRPASPAVLREVKSRLAVPVVAIGGINESNLEQVLQAGADAVAVISAVVDAPDVRAAAARLAGRIAGFSGAR